jgi:hypothetical protein
MPRFKMGEHCFLKKNIHVANEKFYLTKDLETILQQVTHGASWVNTNKIFIQFPLLFHLFNHGHPMATKYMTM